METQKSFLASKFSSLLIFFLIITSLCELNALSSDEHSVKAHKGPVVERGQRKTLFETEYGEISATDVKDGHNTQHYHIEFFTLEPNSVFLPVLLHAAMLFYVHTGSGKLSWANEDGTSTIDIREGDVGSLTEGSVFYIHNNLDDQRKKLRIYAMFTNTDDSTFDPSIGAYSRINELVKGFDKKIIQAAFKVPEDLIEAITNKTETPPIVHAVSEKKHSTVLELEASFLKYFTGIEYNSKNLKTYNIFDSDHDFENCYGWTSTVTKKQLKRLKSNNIGFLMVNLTRASMLGPHWNPMATEVAVVLEGEGMVRVVCGSNNDDKCKNKRFRVQQGDVFVVPRFHPMAQMSFVNQPLVFMGFSTAAKKNHPQFLAGKESVLQILDREIVATSLGVSNTTIDKLLEKPDDSIIFECNSCAEEEERLMEEEKETGKEEEDEKREKEEREREREEEEEVRRREEERKREEEAARRQQEERERRRREEEQEEREREKEGEKEREEEEEEAAARRQQEERERKEEAARREREREKEEARREMERERKRREKEVEREKERKRQEAESEEEAARRQQEERERKREEKEARRRKERGQEGRSKEEEEEEEAEGEEEAARRQQEKRERRREEGEARTEEERREEGREEEGETESETGGGWRQPKRGDTGRRSRGGTEWEEEAAARRQQEERERRRKQGGWSSYEGRRVLKMRRNV
ncbi:cupin family protein [Medicago truncatula]|uniref:Cupin family protein n=2 Tax=Medicago truncatula TaxID=3880 RepID=G7KC87_MEDTR|nr:cupin family protein [Medicago truncatula]